jgi:hypothetical protein
MYRKFCGKKYVFPKFRREPGSVPEEQRKTAKITNEYS